MFETSLHNYKGRQQQELKADRHFYFVQNNSRGGPSNSLQ
jgi:hypothetical protein